MLYVLGDIVLIYYQWVALKGGVARLQQINIMACIIMSTDQGKNSIILFFPAGKNQGNLVL